MRPITKNPITQGKHGRYNAVDYSSAPDPIAYAPENVTFVSYAYNGDCGNNLQVQGATGIHGFCHVETPYIKVGQGVKKGEPLFKMGYNGLTIPAGPAGRHAHWVIRQGNTYVYPPSLINEPFGGGSTPQPVAGGNNMFQNDQEVQEAYILLRGNAGTASERKAWIGQPKQRFFQVGLAEANAKRAYTAGLEKQLADVKQALENEKAKPPKEVVKIVEKVVEKPVEVIKEVPISPPVDEQEVVTNWLKRLWNNLFKKG